MINKENELNRNIIITKDGKGGVHTKFIRIKMDDGSCGNKRKVEEEHMEPLSEI